MEIIHFKFSYWRLCHLRSCLVLDARSSRRLFGVIWSSAIKFYSMRHSSFVNSVEGIKRKANGDDDDDDWTKRKEDCDNCDGGIFHRSFQKDMTGLELLSFLAEGVAAAAVDAAEPNVKCDTLLSR